MDDPDALKISIRHPPGTPALFDNRWAFWTWSLLIGVTNTNTLGKFSVKIIFFLKFVGNRKEKKLL